MTGTVSRVLLWLFVINLGIALGAGLYEARIVVPEWIDAPGAVPEWNPEAARRHDTGRRFWAFVTTVPLTLLTLANLITAWRTRSRARRWWLGAGVAALADRAFTFAYFIPTMIALMGLPGTPEAAARAVQWASLNHVRHLLVLVALLCAMKAFSLVYARGGASTG